MPVELTPYAIIGSFVAGLGLVVLAGLRAMLTGRLWTKTAVDKLEAALGERAAAAERREQQWHQAYGAEAERGRVRDDQVSDLLEVSKTMSDVLGALRTLVSARHGDPP